MSAEWPTAAEWLASGEKGGLVVAGVPMVEHAVTPSRYDLAPAAIRERLARLSHVPDLPPVVDLGDSLTPPPLTAPLTILLGGHNAVTFHALAGERSLEEWGLLTVDAHHDVRPYEPGQVGNGSPVRALVDAGLLGRNVVQVGIQPFSNSAAHRDWCDEAGIDWYGPETIDEVPALLHDLAARCQHVYVDLDLDALDRAFAPGCPGARPGGIAPRQLFEAAFAAGMHDAVRAVDIVEVDPGSDVAHLTVDAAALTLLNVASGLAARPATPT